MTEPRPRTFDTDQLRRIRQSMTEHGAACPVCGAPLAFDPVPRPEAVSYVRARSWVRCGGCGRAGVVDRS